MTDRQRQSQLLIQAGRLLLEYNESTASIVKALTATAQALTKEPCQVAISYGSIAIALGDDPPVLRTVKELRLNAAVQTQIHDVLEQVRTCRIDAETALTRLESVESDSPRHSWWLVALLFGAGASSDARLLGADTAAVAMAGVSTALGLLARQELGRRHFSLLFLPVTAACIGAVLGGIAIRSGWTRTPELVVVVPALMIVPGPHLLNGLFDLIDNQVSMSLSRLGLATGILLASALGIVIGLRLILPDADFPEQSLDPIKLNLIADMILAGITTCGFAAGFNTPWRQLRLAIIGGAAGHGVRYVALASGLSLDVATFFGGLVVGAISAWMVRRTRAPVAVIAFAGAVTMIPGLSLYSALRGSLRLARLTDSSDPALAASTLSNAFEGFAVAIGLALGLVLGIRGLLWLADMVKPRRSADKQH
jgi:uncharacterized membrane protein YjjP (DUF1212 family)